jgi:hypothetical protein
VIANARRDPRRRCALAHQLEGVDPVQGIASPRRRCALAHQLEGVDPVQGIASQLAVTPDRANVTTGRCGSAATAATRNSPTPTSGSPASLRRGGYTAGDPASSRRITKAARQRGRSVKRSSNPGVPCSPRSSSSTSMAASRPNLGSSTNTPRSAPKSDWVTDPRSRLLDRRPEPLARRSGTGALGAAQGHQKPMLMMLPRATLPERRSRCAECAPMRCFASVQFFAHRVERMSDAGRQCGSARRRGYSLGWS